MSELPLAAAQRRLGRPGRPRKTQNGHNAGRADANPRVNGGAGDGVLVYFTTAPVATRLLDLPCTATYLSVSEWTIRDLEAAGVLKRVNIPLPGGRDLRKLLFDRQDLDRLIEAWKDR